MGPLPDGGRYGKTLAWNVQYLDPGSIEG